MFQAFDTKDDNNRQAHDIASRDGASMRVALGAAGPLSASVIAA
jgi:hypothetical protein